MKYNYDKLYDTYIKEYTKASAKYKLNIDPLLSKRDFITLYTAKRNDMLEAFKRGERKSVDHIAREVVRDQRQLTQKQIVKLSQAAKKAGLNMSATDLRRGGDVVAKSLFKKLEKMNKLNLLGGLTISQYFFGSD